MASPTLPLKEMLAGTQQQREFGRESPRQPTPERVPSHGHYGDGEAGMKRKPASSYRILCWLGKLSVTHCPPPEQCFVCVWGLVWFLVLGLSLGMCEVAIKKRCTCRGLHFPGSQRSTPTSSGTQEM